MVRIWRVCSTGNGERSESSNQSESVPPFAFHKNAEQALLETIHKAQGSIERWDGGDTGPTQRTQYRRNALRSASFNIDRSTGQTVLAVKAAQALVRSEGSIRDGGRNDEKACFKALQQQNN
jgi:hypothetical protein